MTAISNSEHRDAQIFRINGKIRVIGKNLDLNAHLKPGLNLMSAAFVAAFI